MVDFYKYHSIGNDYLVVNPTECNMKIDINSVRLLCNRKYGIGADGILYGPNYNDNNRRHFALKIYNSDGTEAEKSGNGLRIFAWYLYERKYVRQLNFDIYINSISNNVTIVDIPTKTIKVNMGLPNFNAYLIAPSLQVAEIINREYIFGDKKFSINCVSIGNPHCVIFTDELDMDLVCQVGPLIECSSLFPKRINVQFVKVISSSELEIKIWERGSGYTLSSGSSSCAAVAVARRFGFVGDYVTVYMPGGNLQISIKNQFMYLTGPVVKVMEGCIS